MKRKGSEHSEDMERIRKKLEARNKKLLGEDDSDSNDDDSEMDDALDADDDDCDFDETEELEDKPPPGQKHLDKIKAMFGFSKTTSSAVPKAPKVSTFKPKTEKNTPKESNLIEAKAEINKLNEKMKGKHQRTELQQALDAITDVAMSASDRRTRTNFEKRQLIKLGAKPPRKGYRNYKDVQVKVKQKKENERKERMEKSRKLGNTKRKQNRAKRKMEKKKKNKKQNS